MPPTPQSNMERYLSIIAGHGGEIPSEPASRVEYYLNEIVEGGGIGGKLKPEFVTTLPVAGETGVLYLVPGQNGSGQNTHNEYIWIEDDSKYELLGQTTVEVDLSGCVPNTRTVGGKPLSANVGISVSGTGPIVVTDNGTASSVAFDISHENSGVTAGSKGDTINQTPDFGETFKVLAVTVDEKGHVTALTEHTVKTPSTKVTTSQDGLMSKEDKAKLDKRIPKGSAVKGVYIDANDNTQTMTYSLNADVPENFAPSTALPLMDGTAALGVSAKYAREDHVHPSDTGKVDKVTGKGLSTNDYTDADKAKVAAALTQHQDISGKVDKVSGKGLSTNDYTTAEKTKLSGIAAEANKTIIDATLSNAGQAADAKTTGDSLSALQSLISRMEIYCEASGNPAAFSDADAANVKVLSVTLTPTQSGSGDPSSSNIRSISGVSSVSVTRTGKNLWPFGATIAFTQASSRYDFNPPLPPGKYALTATVSNTAGERRVYLALFNETASMTGKGVYLRNAASGSRVTADILTIDVPVRTVRLYASWGHGDASGKDVSYSDIQMELGESATSYEPYQGQTVSVQLTDGSNPLTVYGGTLDVTTGTLSVTHANIASYNGETLPGRWISDRDVYASGATPTTGAQVVYKLAAPLTYQLTPQQLATLHGYNAIFTNAGSVSVTHKADPVLSLGGGA